MDKETTVEDLKILVKQLCEERDWDQFHDPKNLAIDMSVEANELLEHFVFTKEGESEAKLSDPKKRQEITEELADVLYTVLRFSQMNTIDLSDALKAKLHKVAAKYPVEKAKGSNKKYTEF
jgi:NTP pyrophosphatase (non-canonical NTP hydrolase)